VAKYGEVSDSIIPLAPPWEPPHYLLLALRNPQQAVAGTVPDSPFPLGGESDTETTPGSVVHCCITD